MGAGHRTNVISGVPRQHRDQDGQDAKRVHRRREEEGLRRPRDESGDHRRMAQGGLRLGRGHAMALVHVIKRGAEIGDKHVGSDGSHRDEANTLRLTGREVKAPFDDVDVLRGRGPAVFRAAEGCAFHVERLSRSSSCKPAQPLFVQSGSFAGRGGPVIGASGSQCHLVSLLPRQLRVEHRVLGFDDRRSRVIDRKRRVVFGVIGLPLGTIRVKLGLLALDVSRTVATC